jgi:hypothetical protein
MKKRKHIPQEVPVFGFIAFVLFLIALIVNLIAKGTDMKYAIDCAYAGACFVALAVSREGDHWRRF